MLVKTSLLIGFGDTNGNTDDNRNNEDWRSKLLIQETELGTENTY